MPKNSVQLFTLIWMNLTPVLLSKRNQIQNDPSYIKYTKSPDNGLFRGGVVTGKDRKGVLLLVLGPVFMNVLSL